MKKTLVISAVLCMYVLLCGCPFAPENSVIFTNPLPFPPSLNSKSFSGKLGDANLYPVKVKFTSSASLSIQDDKNLITPQNFSCTYCTIDVSSVSPLVGKDTLIDVFNQNTNKHFFVVMKFHIDKSGNFASIDFLTLPSSMPVSSVTSLEQSITDYLKIIEVKIAQGQTINVGYDGDSEIKGATLSFFGK